MSAEKYAEVARISSDLLEELAKNDIPGRQDALARRVAVLMDHVASVVPSLAADAHEVSEVARRYYSDKLWRSERGGALVLYSTMKKKLETIKSRADKRARSV
jgi:hypothetical protein